MTLFHYTDVVQNTAGDALAGYFIRLIDPASGGVIPIYADASSTPITTVSGVTNMAKTDEAGNVSLYVTPSASVHLDAYGPDAVTFIKRRADVAMGDPAAAAAALATAADRVQTGLDRVATGADRTQTGLDRAQTGTDVTGANAARDAAVLAAATSGVYPNSAASNVPRGLTQASVGAITAGSGGTNGTFALAWSGGNFDINPTGTFTVSGGALTAVTITGPGLRVGSTATVPTPSFAASSGLTGAAVALTAQFLVTNGSGYWVQSADNSELDRYANVSGVATAVSGVGPVLISVSTAAITSAVTAERATRLIDAVRAAARDPSKVKLLVTKDGAKTYRSGSTTDIQTLAPLIGPATFGQAGTTYDGTGGAGLPLRPIETATGIQFHSQVGLDLANGVVSQTGEITLDLIFRTPALAATYTSVAAMTGDAAARKMGDIVKVTGGPRTNIPTNYSGYPDPASQYLLNMEFGSGDADLAQGLYIYGNGTFNRCDQQQMLGLTSADGSKYLQVYFGRLGRLGVFAYDGSVQASGLTQNVDVFTAAQTQAQHIKAEISGTHTRLWLNGVEIWASQNKADFTAGKLYLNGKARSASGTLPVSGFGWTMDALCITESLDFTDRRHVSDALAAEFGTPVQAWHPIVKLGVHIGQSNGAGSTDTAGDVNRPDAISGWNGMITAAGADKPANVGVTNTWLPRVYCTRDFNHWSDIGPLRATTNQFSNASGDGYVVSGQGMETVEWGLFGQIFTSKEQRNHDWCMIGLNEGGWTLAYLDATLSPNLYELRGTDLGGIYPYPGSGGNARDFTNRMVAEAAAFFATRGQKLQLAYVYHEQGESTDPLTTGYGAAYETSWRNWLTNQLWHIVDSTGPAPVYIKRAINGAVDGVSNSYNVTPYYFDDQLRRLEATRDTTFRFAFLGEGYARDGRFIHKPLLWHRKRGESIGRLLLDAWAGTPTKCFQVTSAARVSGKIRLYLSAGADAVDTAYPTVLARHTTGGVDTFGLVLEPNGGARTITAVDNTNINAATPYIEVTVSGGGAIAGDRINVTGTNARWSNYRKHTRTTGLLQDQDWSGSPGNFTSGSPPFTPGPSNDLTPWLAAGSYVV